MSVRILDVREVTKPIASPIRNAYIDFSKMTTSLVAVVTNVERNGRRVVGYGFNSNGRYGQGGLIRERFAPRIRDADPATLVDPTGENLDPDRVWSVDDGQRKARRPRRALRRGRNARHGDLGRGRENRRQAALPSAGRTARRAGESARIRVCSRRLLLSGQGQRCAARGDARLSRARLHRRQDEDRRSVA